MERISLLDVSLAMCAGDKVVANRGKVLLASGGRCVGGPPITRQYAR